MRSPDGKDFWSTGTYKEVVKPERLVMTDSFSDSKGNVVPASTYGMPGNWSLELQVTVTFEEQDGKTKMTLHHTGFPDKTEQRDGEGEAGNSRSTSLTSILETGTVKDAQDDVHRRARETGDRHSPGPSMLHAIACSRR